MLTRHGVVEGRFKRNVNSMSYLKRRLYGICWTQVYYFKAAYNVWTIIKPLQKLLFKLFGYIGNTDFTIYSDTWIRDLPLITIGKGSYISNRVTIGTNICLKNNYIIVGKVKIGENVIIGHLSKLALGSEIGDNVEIGVEAILGMKVIIGNNVNVGPSAQINHGVILKKNCKIGSGAYLGKKCIIGEGIIIRDCSHVPDKVFVRTQEEADMFIPKQRNIKLTSIRKVVRVPSQIAA
jgi:UDP-3-O-[3-hydroxymyristoyl] glucosamine N-acyltransferase